MTGISLPLLAFRHRIKKATDASWHAMCAQEYAARWWNLIPEDKKPKDLSLYPGDRRTPFGALKISPAQFDKASPVFYRVHIENAITAVTGAFETYMADLIGRCITLHPELLADSEMVFTAKELVMPDAIASIQRWLSEQYVQRSVRNKSHFKLIQRFGIMAKRDVEKANPTDYEAWNRFVMLRNSLVHSSGLVTPDLKNVWNSRFPSAGKPIILEAGDLIAAHKAAYGLASTIDKFALETVIKQADAELLAREIFVATGEQNSATISREISRLLSQKYSKNQVDEALARQRRLQLDTMKEFPIRTEWLRQPHEVYD